jgi:ankyrin repeat protein
LTRAADVNAAASNGATALVRALLDKGADVNAERNDGATAPAIASQNGQRSGAKQFERS